MLPCHVLGNLYLQSIEYNDAHSNNVKIFSILTIVVGKSILLTSDENWNALIDGCKAKKTYTGIDYSSEKDNNEI